MRIIRENFTPEISLSKLYKHYFGGKKAAVFDIETTGLDPRRCSVILTGIIITDGNDGTLTQFFSESDREESEIIEHTIEVLSEADFIITYNGRSFDVPFMEYRMKKNKIPGALDIYNLDLYTVLNKASDFRSFLDSLSQKNVEKFMGIGSSRDDEISGGESVVLYNRYLLSRDPDVENKIMLHNADDIRQLYRLLDVIPKSDFHKAMYKMGFPLDQGLVINGLDVSPSRHELVISGRQTQKTCDYISFPMENKMYTARFSSNDRMWSVSVPLSSEGGALYVDLTHVISDYSSFEKYPAYENGFIIIRNNKKINHCEVNALATRIMREIIEMIF